MQISYVNLIYITKNYFAKNILLEYIPCIFSVHEYQIIRYLQREKQFFFSVNLMTTGSIKSRKLFLIASTAD